MFQNSKFLFLSLVVYLVFNDFNQLSAYVVMPRSTADTTDRMNMGGDPPDRAGLRDTQRSPEYLDDWWGRNDYNYMEYESRDVRSFRHPTYDLNRPPYYPYPNTYYHDAPSSYHYHYWNRNYQPNYATSYYNAPRYYQPTYPTSYYGTSRYYQPNYPTSYYDVPSFYPYYDTRYYQR